MRAIALTVRAGGAAGVVTRAAPLIQALEEQTVAELVGDQVTVHSDYKVGRCSRRCGELDRPLEPGEWYYSTVAEGPDEETLVRKDISAQAWQGPPEGTLGWWKNRMPEAGARKLKLAPDPVLIDLLRQSEPGNSDSGERLKGPLRYLLTLILLRRRVLRAADSASADADPNSLEVEIVADGTTMQVRQYAIPPAAAQILGDQLVELLYCEAE